MLCLVLLCLASRCAALLVFPLLNRVTAYCTGDMLCSAMIPVTKHRREDLYSLTWTGPRDE
jgi:hypothetical protein